MIVQVFWGSDNIGKYQKYIDLNKDKLKSNYILLTHTDILKLLSEYDFLETPLFRRQDITVQADLVRLLVMNKLGGCYIDLDVEFFIDTLTFEEEVNKIHDKDVFLWNTILFFKTYPNSRALNYLIDLYLERKFNIQLDVRMLTPTVISKLMYFGAKIVLQKDINHLFRHLAEHSLIV
jgi:hypothetical protein